MKVFSSEQIREWDQYTIDHEPIASIDLMERASYQCSYWLLKNYGKRLKPVIFCGIGNNGGDGLAIARQLYDRGYFPRVFVVNFSNKRSKDFALNFKRIQERGISVNELNTDKDINSIVIEQDELVIDAIFGSGLNRPSEGIADLMIKKINNNKSDVISIDLPSGMMNKIPGNESQGNIIRANYTLSFETFKLPFLFKGTAAFVGNPIVLSIGLHSEFYNTANSKIEILLINEIRMILKKRERFSHKGTYGHTLIVAGSYGKMGAAVLCAKSCLRTGSGLVTIHSPSCGTNILQSTIPEAMVLQNRGEHYLSGEFKESKEVIAVGPGIGQEKSTVNFLQELFSKTDKGIVIDADALNIIANNPGIRAQIPANSILTPHPKEFERLVGMWSNEREKVEKLSKFSLETNSYVLLKGAYSIVACPDGKLFFNSTGNPGMATAGSGDVLTGIIAGFLSQKYTPKESALLGMFIHGFAGDMAAKDLSLIHI